MPTKAAPVKTAAEIFAETANTQKQQDLAFKNAEEQEYLRNRQNQRDIKDQIAAEKRHHEGQPLWEEARKEYNAISQISSTTYNTWESGMFSIQAAAMKFIAAAIVDGIKISDLPFQEKRAVLYNSVRSGIIDKFQMTVTDKLSGHCSFIKNRNEHMPPELKFTVDVDDEGHIISAGTRDSVPLTAQEREHLDAGVIAWATKYGFKHEPDPHNPGGIILQNSSGEVMTHNKFLELNRDSATSLKNFLTGRFNLEVEHTTGPTP